MIELASLCFRINQDTIKDGMVELQGTVGQQNPAVLDGPLQDMNALSFTVCLKVS